MRLKQFFTSRGYVDGDVLVNLNNESLNLARLPPFVRTLLVTDGTVTKNIEAFFWEPIVVDVLWQERIILHEAKPLIDAAAGEQVLKRIVQLRGEKTRAVYTYATSFLKTDLLPGELTQQLLDGQIGIGEILREVGLETYREIMDFGVETASDNVDPDDTLARVDDAIYRTYRIVAGGKPVMQITESFPCKQYGVESGNLTKP